MNSPRQHFTRPAAERSSFPRTLRIATLLLGCGLSAGTSAADSSATTPRLQTGRPDLNGTWENGEGIDFIKPVKGEDGSICVRDCGTPRGPRPTPDRPKYKPELAAKIKALSDSQVATDPALRCRPPGVPRIGPPDKIVQTDKEVIFLYDDIAGAAFRVVKLNGKHDLDDIETSYFGSSIGAWQGDTLVVDTVGFNDDTWLADNGAIHSSQLHVIERLRRGANKIEYNVTVEDPEVLAEPWQLRTRILELSSSELPPSVPCVEQDLPHVVDGTHHDNLR